jgi:hypothetical protein
MPQDISQENIDLGKTLMEWEFPEFIKYTRSRSWYMTSGLIVVLLFIYSISTANLLFAIIIFFTVVIFLMNQKKNPRLLSCKITEEGLLIDTQLYPWEEIKNFWIIYEPPHIKTLYFDFKPWHLPRLPIPLTDQDPLELREILLDYLEEDIEREGEPISDNIGRKLKIQ